MIERCKKLNFSAVAVTDLNNLFAAIKFNREAKKAGIKPIIGAEVTIVPADKNTNNYNSIFLCRNKVGYKNLCDIATICQKGKNGQIGICESILFSQNCDGIIILAGDQESDIGQSILKKDFVQAKARVLQWERLTEEIFLSNKRLNKSYELHYLNGLAHLSEMVPIRPVATNQVRFLEKHDFVVHHEARVCIQQGVTLE